MTAPRAKFCITPEIVQLFARYYRDNHGTWGVLHVQFGNGNWKMRPTQRDVEHPPKTWTRADRAVAEIASKLSPSQAKRLARKAEK